MVEKRGEKESELVNKLILRNAVSHQVKVLSSKAFITEREVYDLVRGFFKKYINIDYEFTSDELIHELKKIYLPLQLQDQLSKILSQISEIEHLTRSFSRQELVSLLASFESLVVALIANHYEKQTLTTKLKHLFHKSVSTEHKDLFEKGAVTDESSIVKMNILLDNARRWSKNDMDSAKKAYKELMELYNTLDDDKKKAYFGPVNELYGILKSGGN